jgi:hypothetical protein
MECWSTYTWSDFSNIITTLNTPDLTAIIGYLTAIKSATVAPIVRIPMTAAYWLGVPTKASAANTAKYPHLSAQYRTLITKLVDARCSQGLACRAG